MSEINLAARLIEARHKKKITQAELAAYIGVSKAAVSKWESGTSFPDITYLPQLATYFNMSIDELMGYEPQMTREEIKKKYHELKTLFAEKPFKEAMECCLELEKKYYSCFPFLLQLVILYLNHGMLADEPKEIYIHAAGLAERIRELSDDVNDAKDASSLEATLYMLLGEPMRALDLMDEQIRPMSQDTELLAQVYQSIGNISKAKEAYQIAMYQHLTLLLTDAAPFLLLYAEDIQRAEEIINRTLQTIDIYQVDKLHPNAVAGFYLAAAQVYSKNQQEEKALDILQKYVHLCTSCFFPYTLHGDAYFDQIDAWFQEFHLGNQAPRSEKLIRESMLMAVQNNPLFAGMQKSARYRSLLDKLKGNCILEQ